MLRLSISDFKLVFRDTSLRIFLFLPLLIFLVVILLMPYLVSTYEVVEPFVPIVIMGATVQASTMFGFVYSMVLIQEKEMQVAKVYGILPVRQEIYLLFRLAIPVLIAILLTFVLLAIQPFYDFSILAMLMISLLCGLLTPLLIFLVSIFSKNKMEGMTWFKLVNLLTTIPLVSFFITSFDYLFWVIPTYWIFHMIDQVIAYESFILFFGIGMIYILFLLIILGRQFLRVHFA